MEKLTYVLDVGSGSTKLLAGYVLDGQPIVVEALSTQMPRQIVDGHLSDIPQSAETIKKLTAQMTKSLGHPLEGVALVLPTHGLQVYQATKTTNIVSEQGTITAMDFKNLNTLFRKEKLGPEHEQIGIVPLSFELDDERHYDLPPLGEVSTNITLTANVHFVDKSLYDDFKALCDNASIKVRKAVIDAHAISELLALEDAQPVEYLLIDIGSELTTLSFVAEGHVFASTHFDMGARHLTEIIANRFGLPLEEAKALQEHYGYDLRENYFDGIVYQSINDPERKAVVRQSDLNNTVDSFVAEWTKELLRYVEQLPRDADMRIDLKSFPWLVVGMGRQLKGFRLLFANYAGHDHIVYPRIKTLGARSPSFAPCLGLLAFVNKYASIHEEPVTAVTSLERIKSTRSKTSYNEYEDDL